MYMYVYTDVPYIHMYAYVYTDVPYIHMYMYVDTDVPYIHMYMYCVECSSDETYVVINHFKIL